MENKLQGSSFCDWMKNLDTDLHHVPLNTLAIPGSHDSFSYTITKHSPIAPDNSTIEKSLLTMLGPLGKEVMCNWGRCQKLSCREQLEAGVRYFDIRLATKPANISLLGDKSQHYESKTPAVVAETSGCGDAGCTGVASVLDRLFVLHGLYGAAIGTIMRELRAFLNAHPQEIVFLDFNHFYNMALEDHESLQAALIESFGEDKLCCHSDVNTITLNDLWQNGQQVIIFYQESEVSGNPFFWPASSISSPWPNTTRLERLLEFLNIQYNIGFSKEVFHVTQCVLTPDICMVTSNLLTNLEHVCAKPADDMTCHTFLPGKTRDKLNIVIADIIQDDNFSKQVISLNKPVPNSLDRERANVLSAHFTNLELD